MRNEKYLIIILSLLFFISCSKTENTLTLIPDGYIGTIQIWFNQENGIEEKYEGEKRVYEIPENGILKTKFSPQFGYHFPEYYYVSKNGQRTKIQPILDLNKKVLDTIDKNKSYIYHIRSMGKGFEIDSLGIEKTFNDKGIIFEVGNPLN